MNPTESTPCTHRPPAEYKTLDDLFAQAAHFSEWSLRDCGQLLPALFVLSADGPPAMFAWATKFGDDASKNKFVGLARIFCVAHAATCCVVAIETWFKAEMGEWDGIMPSESVDRQECVTLLGETPAITQMRRVAIIRSSNGKFFNVGGLEACPGYQWSGRFSHLLTPPAPPAIREMAKRALDKSGLRFTGVVPGKDSKP